MNYPFTIPDYQGGSIINMMSSVVRGLGGKHTYDELSFLSAEEIKKYQNIVLVIVDGLGYNYLQKKENSFLKEHVKGKMTSTFLSTTSCANTAFFVGYPPQQTAWTGWFMYAKETAAAIMPLPFRSICGADLSSAGFRMEHILDIPSFHQTLDAECTTYIASMYADSPFTKKVAGGTHIVGTESYHETFQKVAEQLNTAAKKRRFIHAYLPEYDALGHEHGVTSTECTDAFLDIENTIQEFMKNIQGTNSLVLITADHGHVEIAKEHHLWEHEIEGLSECLTMPMTGEPRVRYAYVKPDKKEEFEKVVENSLSQYCWCYPTQELISNGLFGLGEAHAKLRDRAGDYVLIMKEGYALHPVLAHQTKEQIMHPGDHGGVTDDEMYVPLVFLQA